MQWACFFSASCALHAKGKQKISVKPAIILFISILAPQLILAALQRFCFTMSLRHFLYPLFHSFSFCIPVSIPVMAGITGKSFQAVKKPPVWLLRPRLRCPAWVDANMGFRSETYFSPFAVVFSHKCGTGAGCRGSCDRTYYRRQLRVYCFIIGTYALCGMLAGTLRKIGKWEQPWV